jgi:hypothetical protein
MSLLHRGRTTSALATIVTVHDLKVNIAGNPYGDGGRTPVGETIGVRVKPDGEAEFDSEAHVRHGSSFALEHHDTYVLYDPEHPEHCEIDEKRLETEFGMTNLSCFPDPPGAARPDPEPDAEPEPETAADGMVDNLEQLAELHANGTLTDQEFGAAKARLVEPG